MKYLLVPLLLSLMGCEKPANKQTLKQACLARQMVCTLTHYQDGSWVAYASRDNKFGHADMWSGHGKTAELAMGELLQRLDGDPQWPGREDEETITKELQ